MSIAFRTTAFLLTITSAGLAGCASDSNPAPSPAPTSTATAAATAAGDGGAHDAASVPAPTVTPPSGGW